VTEIKTRFFLLKGAAAAAAAEYEKNLDALYAERKKWVDDTFGTRNIYSLNREQIAALAVKKGDGKKIPGLRQKIIMTRDDNSRPVEVTVWVPDKKSKLGKEYGKKFESFKRPSMSAIALMMGLGDRTSFFVFSADRNNRYIVDLHIAHLGDEWYALVPDNMFTEGEEPGHKTNTTLTVNPEVCEQIQQWQYLKAFADDEARQAENKKAS
jgi:hypothetical protein